MKSTSSFELRDRDAKGKAGALSSSAASHARDPGTGKLTIRSVTDDLGPKYTALADDAATAEKKREAAMLFSVAETQLTEKEDPEEAKKGAESALKIFEEAGDATGVADCSRLMVHAYKAKADAAYWEAGGEGTATEQLSLGEDFAKDKLAAFQQKGDKVGEGAMWLSIAELIYLLPKDYKRREEALENATKAREIFVEVGAARLEALSLLTLFRIAADKLEALKAMTLASESVKRWKALGDQLGEAKALCALAEAKHLCASAPEALKACRQALKILKETGPRKLEAACTLLIAEICLINEKFKEALPPAKEALAVFEELGYGKGFQPASLAMQADIYTQLGELQKAQELGKEGIKKYQATGDKRGEVLVGNGLILAYLTGDLYNNADVDEALRVAESSLTLSRELGDRVWESQVLHTILMLHIRNDDAGKAAEVAQEAQALLQDTGDEYELTMVLDTLAAMQEMTEDYDAAVATREQQRELCQKMGEKVREGLVLLKGASMWSKVLPFSQENMDRAASLAQEAQVLFQEAEDKGGEAAALQMIAEIALAGGDGTKEKEPEKALPAALEAQRLFQQVGDKSSESMILQTLASVDLEMEKSQEAVVKASSAVALSKKAENKKRLVESHIFSAQMAMAAAAQEVSGGRDAYRTVKRAGAKAMKSAKEAQAQAKKLEDKFLLGCATYALAEVQITMGALGGGMADEGHKNANQAVEIFREIKALRAEADAVVLVAEAYYASGNTSKAVEIAETAAQLAQNCRDVNVEQRAFDLIQRVQGVPQADVPEQQMAGPVVVAASAGPAVPEKKGLDPVYVQSIVQTTTLGALATDDEIHLDSPLMETGMDSLSSVAFRNALNQQMGMNLPAALMFDYPSQRAIIDHVIENSKM